MSDYRALLKHPKWQRLRLQRLDAADWKCETCAATEKTLHVHHKQYVRGRMPWEYASDELEVLCEDCHAAEHGIAPQSVPRTRSLMRKPVDRCAWLLLAESGWWDELATSERECLCQQTGWHGQLFRLIDRETRPVGLERIAEEEWSPHALGLLADNDPSIKPQLDDLKRAVGQSAPGLLAAYRLLGRM